MSFIISLLAATCQRTGERFAISQKLHSLSKTSYCLFAFQSAFKKQCHFQCIFNTIWKYFQYYFKVFSILFQSIFFRYHLKVFSAPLQTLPSFTFASFCKISSPQLLEVGKMWYLGFELQYGSWGSRSWKLEGFPRFFFRIFQGFFSIMQSTSSFQGCHFQTDWVDHMISLLCQLHFSQFAANRIRALITKSQFKVTFQEIGEEVDWQSWCKAGASH